jgi:hypothetical protein
MAAIAEVKRQCQVGRTMSGISAETPRQWKPLSDIPESPCGGLSVSGLPGYLAVRAAYSRVEGNRPRDLLIYFRDVTAVMMFEEFRDPWDVFANPDAPFCRSPRWKQLAFPLLEVVSSRWLESFPGERLIGERASYRHLVLGDIDGTIHVLTQTMPSAELGTVGWVEPDGACHETGQHRMTTTSG